MAYFGEDMDLDPYEGDDYFLNLGLYGDEYGDLTPGQRALAGLPGILREIYARGRELSGNAGGYEDQDGDGIYGETEFDPVTGLPIYDPMNPSLAIYEQTTPVLLEQEVGGGGAPRRPTSTTVDGSASTSGSIYNTEGRGGGMRPIRTPAGIIYVPEGLNPLQLLTQGLITREIYKQETGEDAPDITQTNQVAEPVELEQETGDPLRRTTDTVVPDPVDTVVPDPVDPVIPDPVDPTPDPDPVVPDPVDPVDPDPVIPDPIDMSDPVDPVVTDPVDNIDPGNNSNNGIDPGDGTEPGNGGNGGEGFDYEKFFQMLGSIPAFQSGASFEAGEVPGIYPTAIESLPQASAFIQSILELDRPVSEQQAELKTDIYKDIIGDVREAQSPLMQSLARRSEQLGAQAEGLMGPLSFLEERGATQAGFGQASALGREIDPLLREQQAGRLREEQKNINLQLAGNLLGQQRATAGLMADIESGIYGRMAPDIGVDSGTILGIAGTDIENILGEKLGREYSEAIREGSRREQQAKFLETGISLLPQFGGGGGTSTIGGFKIPGTNIRIGGQQENSGSGSGLVGGLKILDVLD